MQTIIERLKTEKNALVEMQYAIGLVDGMEWAKTISYAALINATTMWTRDFVSMKDFSDIDADADDLSFQLFVFMENNPSFTCDGSGHLPKEVVSFLNGFMESVHNFWKEVEPHLLK